MPNTPLCIRTDDIEPRPWRNGGGVTRELLAWPPAGDWRVRVSVASIGRDGPFSAFPGVERWFAVLDGAGVELVIDGLPRCVRRGEDALRFAGDAPVHCRLLDGPTRDLNLMLQGVNGAMRLAHDGENWSTPPATACGFYALVAGRCRTEDGSAFELAEDALLWYDRAPSRLRFDALAPRAGAPCGYWLAAEMYA